MRYHFTPKSGNLKTGPIPVTMTEKKSCPTICPYRDGGGCYAENFPLSLHWDRTATTGISLAALCQKIAALPSGQFWRMNQAGDLAANQAGAITPFALEKLVAANSGRLGFTYTHHDLNLTQNRGLIWGANRDGFTVNLSANTLGHADRVADWGAGPVVVVLGSKARDNLYTPAGHRVVVCPVVTGRTQSCDTCRLCAVPTRSTIIGFPAHGSRKRKASEIATAA